MACGRRWHFEITEMNLWTFFEIQCIQQGRNLHRCTQHFTQTIRIRWMISLCRYLFVGKRILMSCVCVQNPSSIFEWRTDAFTWIGSHFVFGSCLNLIKCSAKVLICRSEKQQQQRKKIRIQSARSADIRTQIKFTKLDLIWYEHRDFLHTIAAGASSHYSILMQSRFRIRFAFRFAILFRSFTFCVRFFDGFANATRWLRKHSHSLSCTKSIKIFVISEACVFSAS